MKLSPSYAVGISCFGISCLGIGTGYFYYHKQVEIRNLIKEKTREPKDIQEIGKNVIIFLEQKVEEIKHIIESVNIDTLEQVEKANQKLQKRKKELEIILEKAKDFDRQKQLDNIVKKIDQIIENLIEDTNNKVEKAKELSEKIRDDPEAELSNLIDYMNQIKHTIHVAIKTKIEETEPHNIPTINEDELRKTGTFWFLSDIEMPNDIKSLRETIATIQRRWQSRLHWRVLHHARRDGRRRGLSNCHVGRDERKEEGQKR